MIVNYGGRHTRNLECAHSQAHWRLHSGQGDQVYETLSLFVLSVSYFASLIHGLRVCRFVCVLFYRLHMYLSGAVAIDVFISVADLRQGTCFVPSAHNWQSRCMHMWLRVRRSL